MCLKMKLKDTNNSFGNINDSIQWMIEFGTQAIIHMLLRTLNRRQIYDLSFYSADLQSDDYIGVVLTHVFQVTKNTQLEMCCWGNSIRTQQVEQSGT